MPSSSSMHFLRPKKIGSADILVCELTGRLTHRQALLCYHADWCYRVKTVGQECLSDTDRQANSQAGMPVLLIYFAKKPIIREKGISNGLQIQQPFKKMFNVQW